MIHRRFFFILQTKGYSSLLKDDGFSNLNLVKVRRLVGIGLAEMLGTAAFMAMGCGNVVSNIAGSENTHINTVLSFALGISTSIIIFGPISGPLLNPCLNMTCLAMGHMSLIKFAYFTFFQVAGAYLGVAFIASVTPDLLDSSPGFCTTHPNKDITGAAAFAVEFFMSAILSLGLCHVLDKRAANQGGLVFAKFAILVVALVIPLGKYDGGSVNPARSLGPALLTGDWNDQWLYWTAPFVGAAVGAVLYRSFFDASIYEEPETDGKTRDRNDVI
ncbi:Major intrinsic protein [Nesidiocoris tenuis]|uniref:Major intrinsic protein n=1 Tax=Nesidiocoris tenuis TaxID=355587 RepID=A0ABN7BCT6_9HEMI|nr:Major intrinsic protein [Nesidiocoris tenuis]